MGPEAAILNDYYEGRSLCAGSSPRLGWWCVQRTTHWCHLFVPNELLQGACQHHNGNSNAAVAFTRLKRDYPEVTANCSDFNPTAQGPGFVMDIPATMMTKFDWSGETGVDAHPGHILQAPLKLKPEPLTSYPSALPP